MQRTVQSFLSIQMIEFGQGQPRSITYYPPCAGKTFHRKFANSDLTRSQ